MSETILNMLPLMEEEKNAFEAAAPDGVQNFLPGEDHIRIGGQQGQHIKLLRRQADLSSVHRDPAGDQIGGNYRDNRGGQGSEAE